MLLEPAAQADRMSILQNLRRTTV